MRGEGEEGGGGKVTRRRRRGRGVSSLMSNGCVAPSPLDTSASVTLLLLRSCRRQHEPVCISILHFHMQIVDAK